MEVILKQDIKDLGKAGDVVEVKEGYGRNFLIPRGMAVPVDKGNLKKLKHEKKVARMKKARELEEAKQIQERLNELTVTLQAKTGEQGRLFGSITSSDIASALEKEGVTIDRRKIDLAEPLKNLGAYTIPVKVYAGVTAELKVVVESA